MTIRRTFRLRPRSELKSGTWSAVIEDNQVSIRHEKRGHIASGLIVADVEKVIDLLQNARRELQAHAEKCLIAQEAESELIAD